jgi:hypothetical protein
MTAGVRELVRTRAANRCEYCRLHQTATPTVPHHVEHVIAIQHGGTDDPDNLALACDRCNAFKGTNLTSIDPISGKIVALFHPRHERWDEHFREESNLIIGLTEIGRATARLLNMNATKRVRLRSTIRPIF